ncbi:hypothetical protein JCM10213_001301 [Rhodosporidiobolus nylandii]
MASSSAVNGAASTSTAELRQRYQEASRAFLIRDYPSTASALHEGLQLVPDVAQGAWFKAVAAGKAIPADVDLRRRLEILQITFLATLRSSPVPALAGGGHLAPLLELPPARLIKALWHSLANSTSSAGLLDVKSEPADVDILPTPSAAFIHPSLAVSLTLAALKLDEPRLARQVAEAWFGSVDGQVEKLVWEVAGQEGFDLEGECPLDGVRGGSGIEMSGSSILGGPPTRESKGEQARKAVVRGWLKLLDLLVLHVLPSLGEWEAAGDFVRLQGQENGGWVLDERVEASLRHLDEMQQEQARAAAARIQRQKDLDAAKAEKKRESRTSQHPGKDKSKGKSRETSPGESSSGGSSPNSSPTKTSGSGSRRSRSKSTSPAQRSKPRSSPPLASTSFGGLRSHISSYLARPSPSATATQHGDAYPPPPLSRSPISALVSYLRYHYYADPLRMLSVIAFVFAFLTWARRRMLVRRARGEKGIGLGEVLKLVGAKVGETVRMATKVTAL